MGIPLSEVESLAQDLAVLHGQEMVEGTWACFVASQGSGKDVKKLVKNWDTGTPERVADPRRMAAEMRQGKVSTRPERFNGKRGGRRK